MENYLYINFYLTSVYRNHTCVSTMAAILPPACVMLIALGFVCLIDCDMPLMTLWFFSAAMACNPALNVTGSKLAAIAFFWMMLSGPWILVSCATSDYCSDCKGMSMLFAIIDFFVWIIVIFMVGFNWDIVMTVAEKTLTKQEMRNLFYEKYPHWRNKVNPNTHE